tara:strand:- start:255 stop:698 length:444 start_codon:yes stop_codon:yes gene_type:complete
VFISVKIDNLNEFSNSIPDKLNNDVKIKSDKMKITIVKKYLLISLKSKLILVNINLFIKIFFGRLKERIWFIEYLNNEYNLINLNPELVEKKDPPIITNIKKIKVKFCLSKFREKPIFDILLDKDNKLLEKLLLKLKKRKKSVITIT